MTWENLPEPLLLTIFSYLSPTQLARAGLACGRWQALAGDELMWRRLLIRDFKLKTGTKLRPGGVGWRAEYQRMVDLTPNILSEELKGHSDEVLHVSFSYSGDNFVTCSKDGLFIIWDLDPTTIKTSFRHSQNMKKKGWRFTWSSRYNSSDTLLLVSGVVSDVMGEIAVFDCVGEDFVMLAMVANSPYDVMGGWCDDTFFLCGRLSHVWDMDAAIHICEARPVGDLHNEDHTPYTATKNTVLRFRNEVVGGGNYLRCLVVSDRDQFLPNDPTFPSKYPSPAHQDTEDQEADPACQALFSSHQLCLIFLCSGTTSVPHQLGFKRLWSEDLAQVPVLTTPDRSLDMSGHIVGIQQDRSGRYLFVNVRAWPDGAQPSEGSPPPIASEIEMRVVDLRDLTIVKGINYTGHKGYTDSIGAFYIYLDTSELLVGSGSEDHTGLVWDRYYGCRLAGNKHQACVNCVAFHPANSQVMVSVSDDKTVKIWKSKFLDRQHKMWQHLETPHS